MCMLRLSIHHPLYRPSFHVPVFIGTCTCIYERIFSLYIKETRVGYCISYFVFHVHGVT